MTWDCKGWREREINYYMHPFIIHLKTQSYISFLVLSWWSDWVCWYYFFFWNKEKNILEKNTCWLMLSCKFESKFYPRARKVFARHILNFDFHDSTGNLFLHQPLMLNTQSNTYFIHMAVWQSEILCNVEI